MGGSSLIQAAQVRSVISEYNDLKTSFNSYVAYRGKVPGSTTDAFKVDNYQEAFQDMYDANVINTEPIVQNDVYIDINESFVYQDIKILNSKYGNNKWYIFNCSNDLVYVCTEEKAQQTSFFNKNILILTDYNKTKNDKNLFDIIEKVDAKMDDGKPKTGILNTYLAYDNQKGMTVGFYTTSYEKLRDAYDKSGKFSSNGTLVNRTLSLFGLDL